MPYIGSYNVSTWVRYTIRVDKRCNIQSYLKDADIPTAVHYPIPLSKQPTISNNEAYLPVGDMIAEGMLNLPVHPYLTDEAVETIVKALVK